MTQQWPQKKDLNNAQLSFTTGKYYEGRNDGIDELTAAIRALPWPAEIKYGGFMDNDNVDGWNACRAAFLDVLREKGLAE